MGRATSYARGRNAPSFGCRRARGCELYLAADCTAVAADKNRFGQPMIVTAVSISVHSARGQ